MKKLSIYLYLIIFLLIASVKSSFAIDSDIKDMLDTLDGVQESIKELDESKLQEAVKIDAAIEEINKVTEFVKESLENNDNENAIKALEFIEKSLAGAGSLIPQEFSSDMSKADLGSFGEDNMKIITEITGDMKTKKEEKLSDLVSNMMDLGDKGLDSFGIVENLDKLGIETIKLDIVLKRRKEMNTWTKEQWAESWKGDILTDDGKEVISDDEITGRVVDLEKKLQENTDSILEKRTSLTALQTKVDPLNLEISTLSNKKVELLIKYNEELIKQTSNTLTDEEIVASEKIAETFNSDLASLTIKISTAENQSIELNNKLNNLNIELSNEITSSSNLTNQINSLNKELQNKQTLISKRELELDQLKEAAPNIDQNINKLNNQLERVSLERDFIEVDFEKSIDKEVEALKYYGRVLGDTEEEIDFAMREVGVILDGDPRKARAFEIEKYATYAGLSEDYIQKGIDAVNNDDWDTQKQYYKDITKSLAKNPNWVVDVPSNAEFNVMIAEEKAIQEAAMIAMEGQKIKEQVNKIIDDRTSSLKNLASLNIGTLKYAATWEGMPEHEFITKEYDKLINEANLTSKLLEYENKSKSFKPAYDNWVTNMTGSNRQKWMNIQNDMNKLQRETFQIQMDAQKKSRENVISLVEDAKNNIEKIRNEEISKNAGYNYADNINKILDKIPSFDSAKRQRVNEVLSGIGHTDIWFGGVPIDVGVEGAALRAALGEQSDYEAYNEALKVMGEIGEAPVSEYMTGPYWEMTNVKAAAIVRSKKYDYVDDYAYINAYHEGPQQFSTSETEEIEKELSKILGNNNPKLKALKAKIANLSSELDITKKQSLTINDDLAKLDSELKSLKTTEKELNSQITDLAKEFTLKENLIAEKKQSLTDLEGQLNPINEEMKSLDSQRAEINTKLDQQLNTITNQIETQGKANAETNALKEQFENQMAKINNQLLKYNKESKQINEQLTSVTGELGKLETENPEITDQITKLNTELRNVIDIKADMAMSKAHNVGIVIHEKIINTVARLENKSIIQVEGTKLMRIVDTDTLTDEAGKFKSPEGTFSRGSQVYLAGAATRQQLFSVVALDETGDLIISVSKAAAEQINSGAFGLETAKGMVATDTMEEGTYALIDPKTGRQVMDSHTGRALYGGIMCSGEGCGPSSNLGRQVAAKGYVFVRTGDMDQGGPCSVGDCVFNIPKSELETFNAQVDVGIEPSAYGYNDALEAAFVNTKGLVQDKSLTDAAGTVTKEFYSGKFSIMEEGGAESLLQKAQDTVKRLQNSAGGGVNTSAGTNISIATAQVAAEAQVLAVVQAAKVAAAEVAQEVAQEAAAEVAEVVQAAAHQIVDGVRAQKNVNQLIRYSDGSVHINVGRTGVNLSQGQTVVWTGLTDAAANSEWGCNNSGGQADAACGQHQQAIAEAEAASGLKITQY